MSHDIEHGHLNAERITKDNQYEGVKATRKNNSCWKLPEIKHKIYQFSDCITHTELRKEQRIAKVTQLRKLANIKYGYSEIQR